MAAGAADFSGYATKAGLKCADGRTIMPDAFKDMDGKQVPLVWQHGHNNVKNVLGHVKLEARKDGLYAYGYFNGTDDAKYAKELVKHDDINRLSIWANELVERAKQVFHGVVREVSLVMSGANPGATIDYVNIQHADGTELELEDEVIIHTGLVFDEVNFEDDDEGLEHATAQEVYDSLTEEQQELVHYMVGVAAQAAGNQAEHSAGLKAGEKKEDGKPGEGELSHQEGTTPVSKNLFENQGEKKVETYELKHSDLEEIFATAGRPGHTLKTATEEFVIKHGITNIDVLFPEAKTLTSTPEFDKRRTEWVAGVLGATRKSPFSRVKSIVADITMDQARALGYITGNFKKEEWFGVTKRTTGPTTVYKKQKLDRDDIVDITDFDVVSFMKGEMRLMLDEELATAILIGDGRPVDDPANPSEPNPDKIKDPAGASSGDGIRSILADHELYTTTAYVNIADSNSSYYEVFEALLRQRNKWKGTGRPTLYTTNKHVVEFLLTKDAQNRRYWMNKEELASALNVEAIVEVETLERVSDLLGILVNLQDYNVGTDRGGEVSLFDDFDIDYNQYKYLMETRMSGALVKIKSALVIRTVASTKALVDPITAPTMDPATFVVTIPTQTGVTYKNADTSATLSAGAQAALTAGQTLNVIAVADSTHYFATNADDEWSFERPAA